jgi:hypothetical protein
MMVVDRRPQLLELAACRKLPAALAHIGAAKLAVHVAEHLIAEEIQQSV